MPVKYISPLHSYPSSIRIVFSNQENYRNQFVVWDNGRILLYYLESGELKSKEFSYVHLQKRRFNPNTIMTQRFIILPNSFVDIGFIDKTAFSAFDFEPKAMKMKYKLIPPYRLYCLYYKATRSVWKNIPGIY
jgi:hypothetical protein